MTTIERVLSDGKDECTPAIRKRTTDGYPERLRMAALEFRLAETLGDTAKPGWSPRKGRHLSPFLGGSVSTITIRRQVTYARRLAPSHFWGPSPVL